MPTVQLVVPPVPNDSITATRVTLSWEPIDPRERNARPEEFTYLVAVEARGLVGSSSDSRRRRETTPFERCLMAAGINQTFDNTVPGNTTELTLDGIG